MATKQHDKQRNWVVALAVTSGLVFIILFWHSYELHKISHDTRYFLLPVPDSIGFSSESSKKIQAENYLNLVDSLVLLEQTSEIQRINDLTEWIDKKIESEVIGNWYTILVTFLIVAGGALFGYTEILAKARKYADEQVSKGIKEEIDEAIFGEVFKDQLEKQKESILHSFSFASFELEIISQKNILLLTWTENQQNFDLDVVTQTQKLLTQQGFHESQIQFVDLSKSELEIISGYDLVIVINGFENKAQFRDDKDVSSFIQDEIPSDIPVLYLGGGNILLSGERKIRFNSSRFYANLYPNMIDLLKMKELLEK